MSGYVHDLSAEQERALAELRGRVESMQDEELRSYALSVINDTILLRFLRARKFDVANGFEMILNTLRFRKTFQDMGVEAVTHEMVPNELGSGKSFFHKCDKERRPICVIRPRFHDPAHVDPMEAQRYCVFMMEHGRRLLKPPVETVTIIFDMTDATVKNMDVKSVRFLIQMFQNHYPESVGRILVYNSTWLVWGAWKVVQPWLDPVTQAKVCFVDNKTILEHVHEENLLIDYGGKDPFQYEYTRYVEALQSQVVGAEQ